MKKIINLFLLFILLLPIGIDAITPKPTQYNFYKKDSLGNYINDAKFIIYDSKNIINENVNLESNGKYYYKTTIEGDYNKLINLLSSEHKQIINSINSLEDYDLLDSKYKIINHNTITYDEYVESLKDNNSLIISYIPMDLVNNINVRAGIFLKLEEIKTPSGLKKEEAIIPARLNIILRINNNQVVSRTASVELADYILKYNKELDYNNIYDVYKYIDSKIKEDKVDDVTYLTECGKVKHDFKISFNIPVEQTSSGELESTCHNETLIVDEKGNANLEITSSINDSNKLNIKKGDTVKFKTTVRNIGNSPSYNNVITSLIPSNLEYVSGSASNDGEYIDNSVVWNIDYLDSEKEETLEYEVKVLNESGNKLIINSNIKSDEIEEIKSNDNELISEVIENPKTGQSSYIVIFFTLIISIVVFILVKNKRIL